MLLVDTAGGIVPALAIQMFRTAPTWSAFAIDLLTAQLYAHSIGTMATMIMPRIVPRLMALARVYTVLGLLAALVSIAAAGSLLANAILVLLGLIPANTFWIEWHFALRVAILATVSIGTLSIVFDGLSFRLQEARLELRTRQLEQERACKLASEARLSSLESRVHPHFLFNTLNSISALIREDPSRAERTMERLAALLRYSLDTGRHPLVPLRQELRVVRDYLEIEKTRFCDRLQFSIDVPEEMEELEVPPMAVQTLVENSIKHAVSTRRQGGRIAVAAHLEPGNLVIAVTDNGPGFDLRAMKEGHGLDNLRERLTALFGGEAHLEMARLDGRMTVSVAVPQKKVLV
jgi:two-component system, LytTR family, sensor histidine kinase AlgZ